MKKYGYIMLLMLMMLASDIYAQETHNGYNYILQVAPLDPTDCVNIQGGTPQTNNARLQTTIAYYNGLGYPYLTSLIQNSPSRNDLVQLIDYDSRMQESKLWNIMPCVHADVPMAASEFHNYAVSYFHDSKPYVEITYEPSPLSREIERRDIGYTYHNHPQRIVYGTNTHVDIDLAKFSVSDDNKLLFERYYQVGELHKEICSDEDNKQITQFINTSGQIIFTRKGNNTELHYVYDKRGNLCYVIPREIISRYISNHLTSPDDVDLKKLAYVYWYDFNNRCIKKRLPGCEPIYYVYDKTGHLVLSQDGNQRERGYWTFMCYDIFGRTALCADVYLSDGHNDLQDDMAEHTFHETFSSNFSQTFANTGYTCSVIHSDSIYLREVFYYDNYDFLQKVPPLHDSLAYFEIQGFDTRHISAKGLLTGSLTYQLDSSDNYTMTAYYYDYRGRVIQQRSTNHLGGYDAVYTAYDFSGQPTRRLYSSSIAGGPTTTEQYTYSYDHAGRLLSETYQLNNNTPTTLSDYRYDELGRLACKRLHNGIDSVNYSYNIRNTLTRIKAGSGFEENLYYEGQNPILDIGMPCYNGNISSSTWTYGNQTNGYYYFYDNLNRLTYEYSLLNGSFGDYAYTENYNYDSRGNITSLYRWNAADIMDGLVMEYNGNQLKAVSNDYQMIAPAYNAKHYQDLTDETTEMLYDQNGNLIVDLDRNICRIEYNSLNLPTRIQFSNGNQIQHLYDATGQKLLTTYFTRKSTTVVPVGNILQPENSISDYNVFEVAYNGNMTYKRYGRSAPWQQDFVHNHEGYYRFYSPEESYPFYYIKDHLDNIRETWIIPTADNKMCVQRMQYYPSGLPWDTNSGDTEQPYKYNGKEFIEMHGLDEYDSHARWYYPAIARTTTMDPLCEKYYDISPYAWCGNNFVNTIDPLGMDTFNLDQEGYIVNRIKSKEADVINIVEQDDSGNYMVKIDENGNLCSASFEYGVIEQQLSYKTRYINQKDNTLHPIIMDVYKIRGDANAKFIFEFLSNYITAISGVEYSHYMTGIKGDKGLNFITTGHETNTDGSGTLLFKHQLINGYTIRAHNHSHPKSNKASKGDDSFKGYIINQLSNRGVRELPLFYIYYVNDKKYYSY